MTATRVDATRGEAPRLTRREQEVAALVSEGLTNRQIAERLFISERTVEGHVEQILRKLQFLSRAQVAAWVARQTAEAPAGDVARTDRRRLRPRWSVAVALTLLLALLAGAAGYLAVTRQGAGLATLTPLAGASRVAGYAGDNLPAPQARLHAPESVAVDGGVIYVADFLNHAVRRIDAHGIVTTVAGGGSAPFVQGANATSVALPAIEAVAVRRDGGLFLCGGVPARLFALGRDRTLEEIPLPKSVSECRAAAVDPGDGSLFFADRFSHMIRRLAPDGSLSVYAGDGTNGFAGDGLAATAAKLSFPTGLAVDRSGALYIADQGNNRIRRVDPVTGVIKTVAGSDLVYGFSGDGGPAVRAKLALPGGVAVDSKGRVFIADTENHRIRYVGTDGVIRTLADGGPRSGPTGLHLNGDHLVMADGAENEIFQVDVRGLR